VWLARKGDNEAGGSDLEPVTVAEYEGDRRVGVAGEGARNQVVPVIADPNVTVVKSGW
jgi:hypothetical protein